MSPVYGSPAGPGPRCRERMLYAVRTPDPEDPEGHVQTEQRDARCHLEYGHAGNHRCTVPVPGRKGRLVEFSRKALR